MSEFVTREEFDAYKRQLADRRLELINHDTIRILGGVTRLTEGLAELREQVATLRDDASVLRTEAAASRDEILRAIHENHAVLLSAIMQLGKKAP